MPGNPLIDQGTLNRIRGSVVFPDAPELNVTAPYLGKEGISLAIEGNAVDYLESMTGAVTSPGVYMMATCTLRLLKSQAFSDQFKLRMESNALVGDFVVTPDATTFSPITIQNGAISGMGDIAMGGTTAEVNIMLRGYYLVNAVLFDG